MLEKLRELGIRDELIREITEYRETYQVEQEYGSKNPETGTILLWKRSLGAGNYRNFVWREYSVGRSESNGKESVCRESGGSICKTTVGCVVSCE